MDCSKALTGRSLLTTSPHRKDWNSAELLDEVESIVYSGTRINIDYFIEEAMDEDHVDDIYEYFKEAKPMIWREAIDELGSDYTEEEIRLDPY